MSVKLAKRIWQLRTVVAALVLAPLLSLMSFERLAVRLSRAAPTGPAPVPADESLAWWVDVTLRGLPPPWRHTCLKRAIVLYYLMRRAGRTVSLSIGVRRTPEGEFTAHAWLVRDGEPYLEQVPPQTAQFRVIATFPEPRPVAP
jgi:hypothetical protein